MSIAQKKCFNHPLREAVARCPECRRYFCRECVSEHEDRLVCAYCLKDLTSRRSRHRRFRTLVRLFPAITGILVLWLFFYLSGKGLLLIPSSFQSMGTQPSTVPPENSQSVVERSPQITQVSSLPADPHFFPAIELRALRWLQVS
jgi:hypothetical protein